MEVWSSSTPDFIHKVESVDDNSPYYRWTSELDLSAYNDPQYGTATGISVDKTSDAGYVTFAHNKLWKQIADLYGGE